MSSDDHSGSGRALLPKALPVLLTAGLVLFALRDELDVGFGGTLVYGIIFELSVLAAAGAAILRAVRFRRGRTGWALIGAAILCWSFAEVYSAMIGVHGASSLPPTGDPGGLVFYPLTMIALVYLVRAQVKELDWRNWMDGIIAAQSVAALGVAFVFDYIAPRAGGQEVFVSLVYPLADVALLAAVCAFIALTGWRPDGTWKLLLAAVCALTLADFFYALQEPGAIGADRITPLYLVGAGALYAAARQRPSQRWRRSDDGWNEIVIPLVFVVVIVGLFTIRHVESYSELTTMLGGMTTVTIIARLAASGRRNLKLLERARTDTLTGLGNRGAMQADLRRLCETATKAKPATVLLFDLDGFKRYNDTFGHPAGDELLARLGQAMRDAVGENGDAYRIGGDEFCLLLDCDETRFESVTRAAVQALTTREGYVDVSASWGGAAIPREAGDPSGALRLADMRMYAHKEPRRLTGGYRPIEPRVTDVRAVRADQPTAS